MKVARLWHSPRLCESMRSLRAKIFGVPALQRGGWQDVAAEAKAFRDGAGQASEVPAVLHAAFMAGFLGKAAPKDIVEWTFWWDGQQTATGMSPRLRAQFVAGWKANGGGGQ